MVSGAGLKSPGAYFFCALASSKMLFDFSAETGAADAKSIRPAIARMK
jgi:hypothetical protein